MGFKSRCNPVVLLARPHADLDIEWWPRNADKTYAWVTVKEDGWTVGIDKKHAIKQGKPLENRKAIFLEEYEEMVSPKDWLWSTQKP